MIAMAELARNRTNAPSRFDQFCISHADGVHFLRTAVNVDCVHWMPENADMAEKQTTGAQLRDMMQRAGFSVRVLADRAGYASGSGVQRMIEVENDAPLSMKVAKKLAAAFAGSPVKPEEVWALAGIDAAPNGDVVKFSAPNQIQNMARDVPIYGTALGGVIQYDAVAVEQTNLAIGEVIQYITRPPVLKGRRDIYGVYVQGSSMAPRYQDGELVFVDPFRPPMIGDDVIVFLGEEDGTGGDQINCVLIKRIVKRTATFVRLEQFTPAATFDVPVEHIWQTHRVIPFSELFS